MVVRIANIALVGAIVWASALPVQRSVGGNNDTPSTREANWDKEYSRFVENNALTKIQSSVVLNKRQDSVPVYRHRQPWIEGLWGPDRVHALGNCYVDEGLNLPLPVAKYEDAVTHCIIIYRDALQKAGKITARPRRPDTGLLPFHPPPKRRDSISKPKTDKCGKNVTCHENLPTTWHEMMIEAMKPLEAGKANPDNALRGLAVNEEDYQVVRYMIDTLSMPWDYAMALLAYWKDLDDQQSQSTIHSDRPVLADNLACRIFPRPWLKDWECILN